MEKSICVFLLYILQLSNFSCCFPVRKQKGFEGQCKSLELLSRRLVL